MPNKAMLFITGMITFFMVNAQEKPATGTEELAHKLANPVAGLISVPFQSNVDYDIGSNGGSKYTLNFQPVIPITLSPSLNLITRYIIPVVDQHGINNDGASRFGLSDATVSAFFSPAAGKNGIIWGAGPAFLIPIGTDDLLSTRKWAIGPTAVILRQARGLTYGVLTNQLWSFAGDEERSEINQLYLQPFFTKNYKSGAGIGINAEITFNWETNTTSGFLIPNVSGITRLGSQIISLAVGPRIPVGPDEIMPSFGFRGVLTFVSPK